LGAAFFVGDGDVIWFLRRGFAECTIHQAMPFLCGNDGVIFRLKPLQNLQPMERRRLADIFPISNPQLNKIFGDEPSPLHVEFQAALKQQTI